MQMINNRKQLSGQPENYIRRLGECATISSQEVNIEMTVFNFPHGSENWYDQITHPYPEIF